MTTIAYRDGVLAADTQSTAGNSRDGFVVKIAKKGPILAAAAGSAIFARAFLDWFRGGMIGDPPKMADDKDNVGYGHLFTPEGRHLSLWPHGWCEERDAFYSDGSGREFAKGAMSMGASAEQAVRVAMVHDVNTGGEVTVLKH